MFFLWGLTFFLFLTIRFSDPGILKVPENETWRANNRRANFERLNTAHHVQGLYTSPTFKKDRYNFVAGHGVYVRKFDHFCPWVGNLVCTYIINVRIFFTKQLNYLCFLVFFFVFSSPIELVPPHYVICIYTFQYVNILLLRSAVIICLVFRRL